MRSKRVQVPVPRRRKPRTTLRLPESLRARLHAKVVADRYGMRGKSRWVNEAVQRFLSDPSWLDSLGADRLSENGQTDQISLEQDVYTALQQAATTIRREDPLFDNPTSAIIRSAIQWRLSGLDSTSLRAAVRELIREDA